MKLKKAIEIVENIKASVPPYLPNAGEALDTVIKAAVDAEPVKHGHLCSTDAYPHHLYCSECYKTLIPNEDICFEKNEFPKYCMWCGAKLDEEAEDER